MPPTQFPAVRAANCSIIFNVGIYFFPFRLAFTIFVHLKNVSLTFSAAAAGWLVKYYICANHSLFFWGRRTIQQNLLHSPEEVNQRSLMNRNLHICLFCLPSSAAAWLTLLYYMTSQEIVSSSSLKGQKPICILNRCLPYFTWQGFLKIQQENSRKNKMLFLTAQTKLFEPTELGISQHHPPKATYAQ